VIRSTRYRA